MSLEAFPIIRDYKGDWLFAYVKTYAGLIKILFALYLVL